VANLLLLLPIIISAAAARFHRHSDRQTQALLGQASAGPAVLLGPADVAPLPLPVRRWLETSGAVGRPRAQTVRLLQRGQLRVAADKPFLAATAQQYYTVDPPGFLWTVELTMFGILPVVGRDSYVLGRGIEVPVRGSVLWKLAAGDFEYYRWEVLDIETNRPELY
jgi:hypothetical protein